MGVQAKSPDSQRKVTKGGMSKDVRIHFLLPIHLPYDPRNSQANIATTAAHPPLSHDCHRSRLETRCDRLSYTCNLPSMRPIAKRTSSSVVICFFFFHRRQTRFPGLAAEWTLGADEGFGVHPIRVTQFAQRADVELIDPRQREATDG